MEVLTSNLELKDRVVEVCSREKGQLCRISEAKVSMLFREQPVIYYGCSTEDGVRCDRLSLVGKCEGIVSNGGE